MSSDQVKAAVIIGICTIIAACIAGAFPAINSTLVANGFIKPTIQTENSQPQSLSPSISATREIIIQSQCIDPESLAKQKGWTGFGLVDKYGGYQVQLNQKDDLPAFWEANGARPIRQLDSNRQMSSGVWTIYTPFSCRDILGFEK